MDTALRATTHFIWRRGGLNTKNPFKGGFEHKKQSFSLRYIFTAYTNYGSIAMQRLLACFAYAVLNRVESDDC